MAVYCAVKYRIKPGTKDELLEISKDNMEKSKLEKGNIAYNCYVSVEDDQDIFVYEIWETLEDLQAHTKSEHYVKFSQDRLPILESYEAKVYEMNLLQEIEKDYRDEQ